MRFSFEHSGLTENDYKEASLLLAPYISQISGIAALGEYKEPESSVHLPLDEGILNSVQAAYNEKVKTPLKYIVVAGIGGSNLGAKAVYDALWNGNGPTMLFLDTPDDKKTVLVARRVLRGISRVEEVLVIIASKSGNTLETVACAEYFTNELKNKFPDIEERVVVITDENSVLWENAKDRGLAVLPVPKPVGGRYSVFSAVGLFPLQAAGVNITAFREGAVKMTAECLQFEADRNPGIKGASFLANWHKKGKIIHDSFFFNPELESLGKWYRQLLAESIGKSESVGITPTVSIGSMDLHSVGQLYLGGPKDKMTEFIESEVGDYEAKVPVTRIFPGLVRSVEGRPFREIIGAVSRGAKVAYGKRGLPFTEVVFEKITESEIGAYMQWKMIETMYVAKLLGVDAFDQPDVESYKIETKRILNNA